MLDGERGTKERWRQRRQSDAVQAHERGVSSRILLRQMDPFLIRLRPVWVEGADAALPEQTDNQTGTTRQIERQRQRKQETNKDRDKESVSETNRYVERKKHI